MTIKGAAMKITGKTQDSVKVEYVEIDLNSYQQSPGTSVNSELADDIETLTRVWNLCIQCDEFDTVDENKKTVCCNRSIDDRKFINGGLALATVAGCCVIAASFFKNYPVMLVGGIVVYVGLMTAITPCIQKKMLCIKVWQQLILININRKPSLIRRSSESCCR